MVYKIFSFFFLSIFIIKCESQWTSDDLALYDLVEEVNVNFYEWFDIPKDATTAQIKKAYRKLTLEWHPDRNSAEDATVKFRQVAGIYEVLKSQESREKYDNILEHGLPSWRQPIYYYRQMLKFSWYESLLVVIFIATIGHYLMMWASYFEKTLVYKDNMRKSRKNRKLDVEEVEKMMKEALDPFKPNVKELLPMLMVKGVYALITELYYTVISLLEKKEIEEEEEEEETKQQRVRVPRDQQPEFKFEVAQGLKAVSTNDPEMEKKYAAESSVVAQKQAGSSWNPDELAHLVRLCTEKYPVGTPNRWEQMGRVLNRTPEDVIAMVGKMKQIKQEDYTKLLMSTIQQTTPGTKKEEENEWTQEEQRLLEEAMKKYTKDTKERWERIAEAIGTKTKKQVITRFKYLSEMIKKKKVDN